MNTRLSLKYLINHSSPSITLDYLMTSLQVDRVLYRYLATTLSLLSAYRDTSPFIGGIEPNQLFNLEFIKSAFAGNDEAIFAFSRMLNGYPQTERALFEDALKKAEKETGFIESWNQSSGPFHLLPAHCQEKLLDHSDEGNIWTGRAIYLMERLHSALVYLHSQYGESLDNETYRQYCSLQEVVSLYDRLKGDVNAPKAVLEKLYEYLDFLPGFRFSGPINENTASQHGFVVMYFLNIDINTAAA